MNNINQRLTNIEESLKTILSIVSDFKKGSVKTSPSKLKRKKDSNIKIIKSGNAVVTTYTNKIIITGNTYGNKEAIKEIGGKWNKENKGWLFTLEKKDEIHDLMNTHFLKCNYQYDKESVIDSPVDTEYLSSAACSNEDCDIDSDDSD